ncbi:hypothetical protein NPIL_618201, partial [Nephila pilipes]
MAGMRLRQCALTEAAEGCFQIIKAAVRSSKQRLRQPKKAARQRVRCKVCACCEAVRK